MELKIYKKPNPLKVFDKVSKLKKLLKPIKVKNSEDFIDELLSKPQEILTLLFDGFSAKDAEYLYITCDLKCNIPIGFSAFFGNGAYCWITGEKPNGESLDRISDRNGIIEILENIELPDKIIFTEIELNQKIQNSKSEFKYSLTDK
ncbi:MAG: hypothetical protein RIM83_09175 [Allomuricauda sp.]